MSALLDTREGRIAVRTRLYRRLAAEQEYMDVGAKEDVGDRIDAISPDLALIDGLAIEDAEEIDLVSAMIVRLLSRRRKAPAGVRAVLSVLDPDRTAAIVLALPEDCREAVFGERAERMFEIDEERLRAIEAELRDSEVARQRVNAALGALGIDGEAYEREARKHLQGLPADLTEPEIDLGEDPRAAFDNALAELGIDLNDD